MKPKGLFALPTALGLAVGLLALLVGLPMLVGAQGPLDNTFTYQGRLRTGGSYVDDTACDFEFGLYEALTGLTQAGITQTVTGVAMRDGYFTVILNTGNEFGPSAFTGDKRYLQVGVRCGADADFTAMGQRVALNAVPYALYAGNAASVTNVPWTEVISKPPGFADDVDNVVTYTAGLGLALTGNQFSVATGEVAGAIPQGIYQRRVIDSCSGLQAIQAIMPDGSVVCGDANLVYEAGEGLLLNGNQFSIDETVVQRRVGDDCDSDYAIRRVNISGTVECEPIPQGDITEVVASDGLTGTNLGGPVVELWVENRGITTAMIADGAVTAEKIRNGTIDGTKITDNAVDTSKIANGEVYPADISQNGCTDDQIIKWDASAGPSGQWVCANDDATNFTAGDGIRVDNGNISADVGKGLSIDTGSERIVLDFAPDNTGSNQPTRSNHDHNGRYPQFTTTPTPKDLEGSYGNGFDVVGLKGMDIHSAPYSGRILKYHDSSPDYWNIESYGFSITICRNWNSGTGSAEVSCAGCGGDYTLLAGGGACSGGSDLRYSMPDAGNGDPTSNSTLWKAKCKDDDTTAWAYVLCVRQTTSY